MCVHVMHFTLLFQFTFQAAKLAAGCVNEITEQVAIGKVSEFVMCIRKENVAFTVRNFISKYQPRSNSYDFMNLDFEF